ncbi:hypothetical protein AR457_02725 [Streptomyces agglomeratus]|uniref:Uncharacterized protein n=1 Tax=Streptomyces agglomeratus TaxID=285458 RepID=A0A1E5P2J0_9ACTN|nr:hypothetical protein [Streptomyces agglomeratus]OEJ23574.1 hypothetical protein AS594_02825 [Streptomyces agglomeratus]OEJ43168.1 hypothetical protein AR457_02725 [Streptomyces agglomeratus]OEJ54911.1 hypothetical protein BGK72_33050 [Streptomyces agglomeratus]OEJ62281.1 hypothetical protein BGM19_33950 [Streptomyces agglomeratus]
MINHRRVRLPALATATALLVLGAPASAVAQCSNPDYKGSRSFPGGACPEHVAGFASGAMWGLLALAAGLWLISALRRSRSETDTDLAAIDAVFGGALNEESAAGRREADHMSP